MTLNIPFYYFTLYSREDIIPGMYTRECESWGPSQNFAYHRWSDYFFFFFLRFKKFIYLRKSEREHEQGGRTEGKREADFLLSREPDMGLDPRTQGS